MGCKQSSSAKSLNHAHPKHPNASSGNDSNIPVSPRDDLEPQQPAANVQSNPAVLYDDVATSFGPDVVGAHGKNIKKYRKIRLLGSGAFAAVWLVQRYPDRTKFAAKIVDTKHMSVEVRERLEMEVESVKKFSSVCPVVIQYVEHFTENRAVIIITEVATGGDLRMDIHGRTHKPYGHSKLIDWRWHSQSFVSYVFVVLAVTLHQIHKGGMMHRDIKLGNILLMEDGSLRLADFGFCCSIATEAARGCAKDDRIQLCGTPYCLAPEVWSGRSVHTPKSDVWSLGVLLYELMSLRKPFSSHSLPQLKSAIITATPQPLPKVCETFSEDLNDVTFQMLEKDPRLRPSIPELFLLPCMFNIIEQALEHLKTTVSCSAALREYIVNAVEQLRQPVVSSTN